MTYGLEISDSNGDMTFSSSDVTWNQVAFFLVNGGSSASHSYPIIAGRTTLIMQVQIDAPPLSRKAIAFTTSVSGTTVSVSGGSENTYILVLMK